MTQIVDRPQSEVNVGFFGPDSVAWKVWSHPVAFIGLMRSLLAEVVASPEASAALEANGVYNTDPRGRLARTMEYFWTVVFADTVTVDKANLRLRRMHAHFHGEVPATGQPYDALDPVLMLGTQLITWHSVYYAYERLVGPLPADQERQYFQESVLACEALGINMAEVKSAGRAKKRKMGKVAAMDDLPATREEYRSFFEAINDSVHITLQTQKVASSLLNPPDVTLSLDGLIKLSQPFLGRVLLALLPIDLRRTAGLSTSKTLDAAAIAAGRLLTRVLVKFPAMRRAVENNASPRGYALQHQALTRCAHSTLGESKTPA